MEILMIAAASLSVFLIVTGVILTATSPRSAVMDRLEKATAVGVDAAEKSDQRQGLKEDFLWVLGRLGRLSPRKNKFNDIQLNLIKADVMMRAEEYIGLTLLVGITVYTITFLVSDSILMGFVAALISLAVPGIVVNSKKAKRFRTMTDQLPEALNIISSGLRAGFSFPQALSVLVREMEGPLTTEFMRVLKENRLGKPMDDALHDLMARIENDDLEMLITALLIQRQVGGNLAEVLDTISHTIRERVRIKGEIKTLTAEGKLSGIILSALPLVAAFGLTFINPEFILPLVQEPIGIVMIVAAVIMQVIGILIIRKIVNIDV